MLFASLNKKDEGYYSYSFFILSIIYLNNWIYRYLIGCIKNTQILSEMARIWGYDKEDGYYSYNIKALSTGDNSFLIFDRYKAWDLIGKTSNGIQNTLIRFLNSNKISVMIIKLKSSSD